MGFIFYKYLSDQEIKFLKENDFTEDDIKNNYILGFYSNTFGLEFIDSFVITPFDCESQYQSDIENKENNLNPKQFKDISKYKQINPKLYPILLHGLKTK